MNHQHKNHLQELCHKHKSTLPQYETWERPDFRGRTGYKATVSVFSQDFQSDGWFPTKKTAEQSAASVALERLTEMLAGQIDHRDPSNAMNAVSYENHTEIYKSIETYIKKHNGFIKNVRKTENVNVFLYNIRGKYKYCQRVERSHERNGVFFLVDYINMTYAQRCYDPDCTTYQSDWKPITSLDHSRV